MSHLEFAIEFDHTVELRAQLEATGFRNSLLSLLSKSFTRPCMVMPARYACSLTRGLESYRTEWMIYVEPEWLARSVDFVTKDASGGLAILDWKRSKKISSEAMFRRRMRAPFQDLDDCNFFHYALQLNVYAYILRTEYGLQVRELLLGVFHPTQSAPICVQLPSLQREVEAAVQALKREGRASDSVPGADSHFHGEPV